MKRRRLLTSLGTLASGTTLALGTGAFTSVSADRSVTVETTRDESALLALDDIGSGYRSREDDGEVAFTFPSSKEKDLRGNLDLGLGRNSIYEFDGDIETKKQGLLKITNQGTQSVEVYSRYQTESELEIELYDVTDSNKTALRDNPVTLGVGEHVNVGFRIRTFDADIKTFNETLTIVGETSN